MTDFNYGPLASKAVALIRKFGADVTLSFTSSLSTPADATKPWRGQNLSTPATYTPRGVVASFDKKVVDGDTIRQTDQQLLVAGQDPEVLRAIADGHQMIDVRTVQTAAGKLACMLLTPIAPGATILVYTFRLRQA